MTPPVDAGPAMGGEPVEIIKRDLTLKKGKITVEGALGISHTTTTVAMMSSSSTSEGILLGGGYGLTDKITVGGSYGFTLNSFEIKGPLTLFGSFSPLVKNDKLVIGASGDLVFNFGATSTDAMGMVTSSTAVTLHAGLAVRYMVTDKIAVFTGNPLSPGPLGQHLAIGFNSGAPISFDIPVGGAMQVTPQIYAWLSTDLAHIKISNTANQFIFADFIPVEVGAFFSPSNKMDIGGAIGFGDLKSGVDSLDFAVIGRMHM